ncbi:MAG: cellulase family glycosylhydrolase [Spirochaetales bacterium]|nr:cellulase family glycosylhydrolase [Spirochaetales bacterium]
MKIFIVLETILMLTSPVFAQMWRVDDIGNLTVDGEIFRIKGGSWTGLEGREMPSDEPWETIPAPMEMYIGNVWWVESGRTYEQDINEFKQMGFNLIRLPVVPQTLDPAHPHGRAPYLKNTESVQIENARLALETVIRLLDEAGIFVLLDIHSCSNDVGWRAGRLDDRPPWIDADWDNYDFSRENYDCSGYGVSRWLDDLRELAGMGTQLGVGNIMGIEIFNEPYDYSWSEWRSLIDQAYNAIDSVNSDILVFAGGIGPSNNSESADSPHGVAASNPGWGENLYEAGDNPPSMPKDRLVYCPHAFGPSMYVQKQFMDPAQPECAGMEGDEAGDNRCNIVINPALLEQGWEEHFGYLKDLGYAVVIGAFGGNPDWPDNTEERVRNRYDYLGDTTVDWQWQNAFIDYLLSSGIADTIYWSINPESLNLGGIYGHAYDPVSNTGGWGTWESADQRKLDLLRRHWDAIGPPAQTPTTQPSESGDVNGDNTINIIDALLTARYYVGIIPDGFIARNADVDCDGGITIVDALLIARYYVGLVSSFDC